MAQDPAQIVFAPGGKIWVGAVGVAEPADEIAAPGVGWTDIGHVTVDGVAITPAATKQDVGAWSSPYPIDRRTIARELTLAFALEQWNKDTIILAFDGGTVTTVTAGHFKYAPPGPTAGELQRAIMVEYADGAKHYRWIFRKMTLDALAAVALKRTENATLPLTWKVLGQTSTDNFIMLTDDPAYT